MTRTTQLERTYDQLQSYDTKIVLGDFNAQLGKEEVFAKVVRNHGLHDSTSGDALRLVDFASGRSEYAVPTPQHPQRDLAVP